MSFSMPMTSNPCSTNGRTDSEPISPPDPVTMTVLMSTTSPQRCQHSALVVSDPRVGVLKDLVRRTPRTPRRALEQPPAVGDVARHVPRPPHEVGLDGDRAAGDILADGRRLLER